MNINNFNKQGCDESLCVLLLFLFLCNNICNINIIFFYINKTLHLDLGKAVCIFLCKIYK